MIKYIVKALKKVFLFLIKIGHLKKQKPDVLESEEEEEEEEEDKIPSKTPKSSEDKISVSRVEFEKLKEDKELYKTSLLALKKSKVKSRKLPTSQPAPPKANSEFVTRLEFEKLQKKNLEQIAISDVVKEIGDDLDGNFDKAMIYYANRHGDSTLDQIKANIKDAYTLFRSYNPMKKLSHTNTDRKIKSNLMKDAGLKKGAKKTNLSKGHPGERKILKGNVQMKDWYTKPI